MPPCEPSPNLDEPVGSVDIEALLSIPAVRPTSLLEFSFGQFGAMREDKWRDVDSFASQREPLGREVLRRRVVGKERIPAYNRNFVEVDL